MKRLVSRLALVGAALVFCGCTDLDDIQAGVCGNGVVEGTEDCDGSPGCNPAGKAGACRFPCEAAAECPSGWQCGADSICREPSGEFDRAVTVLTSDQLEVAVGELNGSRPADLVSIGPNGEIVVRYGGNDLKETSTFRSEPILPAIGKLSTDQIGDLAHATTRALGVLLGTTQKVLRPMAYSPIAVGDTQSRFIITEARRAAGPGDFVYLLDEILQLSHSSIIDALDPAQPVIATLPFDVTKLTPTAIDGEIPVGDIDARSTSPCNELVLAEEGATKVTIYSPCKADGFAWNGDMGALPTVKLPAGAQVSLGTVLTDIDGDKQLDLLILGPPKPVSGETPDYSAFVAFGAGDGTFNSSSPAVPGAGDQTAAPLGIDAPGLPLAAGDLNGDGRADFVFPNKIIWSRKLCPGGVKGCYDISERFFDLKQARIADLNGNQLNDLVAIVEGSRNLYFFNGNGTNLPTPYEIPIEGDPTGLALGDFDGDLVRDVAVAQRVGSVIEGLVPDPKGGDRVVSSGGGNVFTVAFGNIQGPPSVPQRMGELGRIDAMASGHLAIRGLDVMADVGVLGLDQKGVPSVAIFNGASNRQLQSPFELSLGAEIPDTPAAVQVGRFDSEDAHGDIAVIAVNDKEKRLWLVPATGDAVLSVNTAFSAPLTAQFDPCAAFLAPIDAVGDQREELYIVARAKPPDLGTQIIVARAGAGKWEIDEPVAFDDFTVVPHVLRHLYCRDTISEINLSGVGDLIESKVTHFGDVEVADLDGAGPPELVLLAFNATESESSPFEAKLVVFPGGNLASRIDIALPADRHPFSFAVLNADSDPEPEIAYFSPQGIYVADLDLESKTLTDIVTLMDLSASEDGSSSYEDSPPLNMVAGDFNGDGIMDVAMAYQLATDVYYGRPVNP